MQSLDIQVESKSLQHSIIFGGAGFIGTNLVRKLLFHGHRVTVVDNLSKGRVKLLSEFTDSINFCFIEADISDRNQCRAAFLRIIEFGVGEVWHLAANSDIPAGVSDPTVDLKDTFMTTFEILLCMKEFGFKHINFASSSAVYGDWLDVPLHESLGPLRPISNYGAMKLASEAQISSASESFLEGANIFRFPNVVGTPATHGVIYDFVGRLRAQPEKLEVLGNCAQQKSYLHVSDLLSAMLVIRNRNNGPKVEIVNIGAADSGVTVSWIAEQVVARVSPSANIFYGADSKGWVGDVPKFSYSTEKLQGYGWFPKLSSTQAIRVAVDEIADQVEL